MGAVWGVVGSGELVLQQVARDGEKGDPGGGGGIPVGRGKG